ncbi:MAG: hypothetical protein M3N43_09545 [Actinomycetota bacterium]|nr:hypothetical protein [Actinomycetota bacterium]
MEILHRQDKRTLLTVVQHEVSQECKGLGFPFLWTPARPPLVVYGHIEKLEEHGCVVFGAELSVLEIALDFGRDDLRFVNLGDPTALTAQATHREVGGRAAIGQAVSFPVEHRLASQTAMKFCEQP